MNLRSVPLKAGSAAAANVQLLLLEPPHLSWLETANFGPLAMASLRRANFEPTTSFVYFIANAEACTVKIGVSSDVQRRLTQLQLAAGEVLCGVGALAGSFELERELHRTFEADCVRGEWFRITPRLAHLIKAAWEAGTGQPWGVAGDRLFRGEVSGDEHSCAPEMDEIDRLAYVLGISRQRCKSQYFDWKPA